MHFISWKLINYWLSYAIFQKCLQILWNPLQIFSTELQNSLRYLAGQGLKAYGIEGPLIRWITNFLSNRIQRVVVNNEMSTWSTIS